MRQILFTLLPRTRSHFNLTNFFDSKIKKIIILQWYEIFLNGKIIFFSLFETFFIFQIRPLTTLLLRPTLTWPRLVEGNRIHQVTLPRIHGLLVQGPSPHCCPTCLLKQQSTGNDLFSGFNIFFVKVVIVRDIFPTFFCVIKSAIV